MEAGMMKEFLTK